jgi:GAF domain-containing protein/anti-sigma regulatory factor (Ser/Thr protein kinase)
VQARTRELTESLEQQTATSEVLSVISSSPTDVRPVLDAIVKTAATLCSSKDAVVLLKDGTDLRIAAHHGPMALDFARIPIGRDTVAGRSVVDRVAVHVHDLAAERESREFPLGQQIAVRLNQRTVLGLPLLREGEAIGCLFLRRTELRPFTEKQIALLQTFADQAVIAIENTRLFEAEQTSKRELQESLEYQTAISEVLSVISRSPSLIGPVMETIANTARKLCQAERAIVWRIEAAAFRPVAFSGMDMDRIEQVLEYRLPLGAGSTLGRAAQAGRAVQVLDTLSEPGLSPVNIALSRSGNIRTVFAVPLLRDGQAIGGITLSRTVVAAFTEPQIALVETFADQAVIAIENARLLEAEQTSKRDLQESLEYQTATSDVLDVISRSPTDVQPVFAAIAQSAARLCKAELCNVFRFDGRLIHIAASHVPASSEAREINAAQPPIAPGRGSAAARAIATKEVAEVRDVDADPDYQRKEFARAAKMGSTMAVPMLQQGVPIGAIAIGTTKKGAFPARQVELLRTFADQAVIAIQNTRLFEEVQARTRELSESLEYQTATAEVLGVLSRSPTDVQPVFEAIAKSAAKLCNAFDAVVLRVDGDLLRPVAQHGAIPIGNVPLHRATVAGRSVIDRRLIHVEDLQAEEAEYPEDRAFAKRLGSRTTLSVPLLRDGLAIGSLQVRRDEVQPFSDKQITLLQIFADQAVIAIENARLFEEVQARNRDLTALGEVGRAVSSTLDLKIVLKTIVDRAVDLSGTDVGSIYYYHAQAGRFELGETAGLHDELIQRFRRLDITATGTGLGEAILKREPLQIPDVNKRASSPLRDAAIDAGLHASLIVPLLGSEGPLGALVLQRRQRGEFLKSVVSLMQSFADQSAIALENARLFNEIAQKGRELEIASQHKSQFVANMSHELRTPLAAILGYAELMQEGFYEPQGPKSLDALTRIRSNGKHLLGLINTVLDIAKIESGQFSLNLGEYAIENVVETVRAATEALAETKRLGLKTELAGRLPVGVGDEQRLTQVLLNLVGNAIKFTDRGEVRISATAVNSQFDVRVTDTGPGVPIEEQKRIFEQFHQVDSSNTKAKGGTGLGLAIAKQIVEMHGGRIWVESIPGTGATFGVELPVIAQNRMAKA